MDNDQRRAQLLGLARRAFSDRAYDDVSVDDLARVAGISKGLLYHYFPTKRDLLIKTVEQWYLGLIWDYDQKLEAIEGTWNRLRFMIWRHLRVIHDEPAMCRLIFNELRSVPEYRETAVFELNREYTNRTLAIVQEAMDSGEFRAGIPLRIVREMIYGGIEHHTWSFLRGEGQFSPEESADAITDIIYRGLVRSGVALDRGEEAIRRLEDVADRLEKASGAIEEASVKTGKSAC